MANNGLRTVNDMIQDQRRTARMGVHKNLDHINYQLPFLFHLEWHQSECWTVFVLPQTYNYARGHPLSTLDRG